MSLEDSMTQFVEAIHQGMQAYQDLSEELEPLIDDVLDEAENPETDPETGESADGSP